jgi:hypothetical protein
MTAVGRTPKQEAKKRYELAKSMLARSEHSIQAWLLVVGTFPGWRKKMVDDPGGDRFQLVYDVTAPNGKSMLVYPKLMSKDHEAEVDRWMRKETGVLEQLEKEVSAFEEAARAPAEPPMRPPAKGAIPIAEVDFTEPERHFWLVDFGLRDERGRAVGCMARFYAPGEYRSSNPTWLLSMQATRNGERFGSSHGHLKADSREALERLARKTMLASFKRYSKLYGAK